MNKQTQRKIRSWNIAIHRDLGYFFSALVLVYALSGIALNHVHDWNPDFVILKEEIEIPSSLKDQPLSDTKVTELGGLVGEQSYKVYDSPTRDQVKIYYDNASFHVNFTEGKGVYEKIARRHVFYEVNALHRNSLSGWKWFSDIFAVILITLTLSGMFILRGKYGFSRRGKWLIGLGTLPPIIALVLLEVL